MHSQESEVSLINQAVQGDRTAFTELYEKYVDRVYRHVYYRVSSQADAEDITQEVFIKAWKAIKQYKYKGASFMAWLSAIAHNSIVDYYRSKKEFISLEETEVSNQARETSLEEMAEIGFNQSYIRSAILKLKGDKQKVILKHFIDGFSYREIARALNKSEGAVRVIQYRALNDLRLTLKRDE